MSLIKVDKLDKVLVYAHEKDAFENTKTLSFLSNSKTVKFIDLSDTKCKGKGHAWWLSRNSINQMFC